MGYTVAVGHAFDGIKLYGVFDTPEEAEKYADLFHSELDWSVVPINPIGESA